MSDKTTTDCELDECDKPAVYRVRFGPPRIESYWLCEEHADDMMAWDEDLEDYADPEVIDHA